MVNEFESPLHNSGDIFALFRFVFSELFRGKKIFLRQYTPPLPPRAPKRGGVHTYKDNALESRAFAASDSKQCLLCVTKWRQ